MFSNDNFIQQDASRKDFSVMSNLHFSADKSVGAQGHFFSNRCGRMDHCTGMYSRLQYFFSGIEKQENLQKAEINIIHPALGNLNSRISLLIQDHGTGSGLL